MDPYAQRLLDLTREARTPGDADKQRVARALSVTLGLAVASSTAPAAAAATAAASGTAVSGSTTSGALSGAAAIPQTTAALVFKWTAGLAVVAGAVTAGYYQLKAPAEPAPVERPAQVLAAPPPVATPPAPTTTAETETAPAEPAEKPARRSADGGRKSETLAEELDLLHEAQAKWRNRNPAAALSLLSRHRQRYPNSALGQEREALRVLSLCAAGRTDEAKAVARRSFRNAPKSPLRATVDESCVKE
jgi:hypothetical protein